MRGAWGGLGWVPPPPLFLTWGDAPSRSLPPPRPIMGELLYLPEDVSEGGLAAGRISRCSLAAGGMCLAVCLPQTRGILFSGHRRHASCGSSGGGGCGGCHPSVTLFLVAGGAPSRLLAAARSADAAWPTCRLQDPHRWFLRVETVLSASDERRTMGGGGQPWRQRRRPPDGNERRPRSQRGRDHALSHAIVHACIRCTIFRTVIRYPEIGVSRLIPRRREHPSGQSTTDCLRRLPGRPLHLTVPPLLRQRRQGDLGVEDIWAHTSLPFVGLCGVHPPCLATMGRSLPRLVTWLLAVAVVLLVVSAFVSRTYCILFSPRLVVFHFALRGTEDSGLPRWLFHRVHWVRDHTPRAGGGGALRFGARCWFCVNARSRSLTWHCCACAAALLLS